MKAVVSAGHGKGEMYGVVVGPEKFGGVVVGEVPAGGESGVKRVSGSVGWCHD